MPAIKTLEQLQSITHAFDNFVTVEGSNLPDYYKGVFPHHCNCGAEIIMTRDTDEEYGYTQLQCCDPDCWIKMAHKFAYFVKSLGYKGYGATSVMPLFRHFHDRFLYPTFLCLFDIPSSEIRGLVGDALADGISSIKEDLKNDVFQFKDAIVALGIPDIGKGCSLFDVVKSPEVLMGFILKGKLPELCAMCGIQAPKTLYYLTIARVDIITLIHDVMPKIVGTPKNEVNVAITGSVTVEGQGLTRAEFIWKCESLLDSKGSPAYKLIETKAASRLDYVIADAPSNSSKYELGKRLGILVTADDFYTMLKKNLGEGVSKNG